MTEKQPTSALHFGEKLRRSIVGHTMTRELYGYPNRAPAQYFSREQVGEKLWASIAWSYRDEEHTRHSDVYLLAQRDQALVNFDLSMSYFASLDKIEFEEALQHVLLKGRTFRPVQSLADWSEVEGAYIMVFDEYKQFYIGQSSNIRKRIRTHWATRKPFDKLILGDLYESIFPVDEFRAFDNTRIYAARSRAPHAVEERAEKAADQRFSLNRMGGGIADPWRIAVALSNPRARTHEIEEMALSYEDYEAATDQIRDLAAQSTPSLRPDLVSELAGLDMTIYSVRREAGESFLWSRRDAVRSAAVRGELSVEEYSAFLTALGEDIIWPAEPRRARISGQVEEGG
ncbi:GIY-YIG nuclease family protein [Arthrobacter sp. TMS2-4]